uniref:Uncharacterized protein n=1 Tax=Myotis myotis TaxID=51298 RepID=A0A7J7WVU7_MYOMY|nr:hypothetical protein mMyoMyo1_011860 [Myotis myotis]
MLNGDSLCDYAQMFYGRSPEVGPGLFCATLLSDRCVLETRTLSWRGRGFRPGTHGGDCRVSLSRARVSRPHGQGSGGGAGSGGACMAVKDRTVQAAGEQAPPRHLETLAAPQGEAHMSPKRCCGPTAVLLTYGKAPPTST